MTRRTLVLFAACVLASTSAARAQAPASFDSNGVPIHYLDRGSGSPVVLIHGFTGTAARHWEGPGVVEALTKAGFRAIAMDCRGHGESGKPHDATQYGLEMVGDVVRLLDHLKVPRAHIVGYSMGGHIAAQMLTAHADRVITVTLLGAGWEGEDLTVIGQGMTMLADGFEKRDASWLMRRVGGGGPEPTAAEVAAAGAALFARNDVDALVACARGMLPLYVLPADRLRATKVPVLALIGEFDQNRDSVTRLKSVVRGIEVVDLPGANHQTSVRPSAAPLVAFLEKHRRE